MGGFFSRCSFLAFQNFISPSIKHPVKLFFSMVVCICKIHVFNGLIPCQITKNFWIMSHYLMDYFEIFTRISEFMVLLINDTLVCLGSHFKYNFFFDNVWSWKLPGVCFLTQEIKNDIEFSLKPNGFEL